MMQYGYSNSVDKLLPKFRVNNIQPNDVCHPFITKHNLVSGLTMDTIQQAANCQFATDLKGITSINGNDLLTKLVLANTCIFPLCPIEDSLWSFETYALEFLSGGTKSGSYHNFVLSDGSVQGVRGGVGKFFNSLQKPSFYNMSIEHGAYVQSNLLVGNSYVFGVGNGLNYFTGMLLRETSPRIGYGVNAYNAVSYYNDFPVNQVGLMITSRSNGNNQRIYKNTTELELELKSRGARLEESIFFHAGNDGGTPQLGNSTVRLSMYITGLPILTLSERQDLYYSIQNYQTNIITGGRNVL